MARSSQPIYLIDKKVNPPQMLARGMAEGILPVMRLSVFVEEVQMGDRGLLVVGDVVEPDIRGLPIGHLIVHMPEGAKVLRRTGVFEHVFAGKVQQVRSETVSDRSGNLWQQILVDCGAPVTIDHIGRSALSLRGRLGQATEVTHSSVGTYVGGTIVLTAEISFYSSRRLAPKIEATVQSIHVLEVDWKSGIDLKRVREVNFASQRTSFALGAILDIEL